MKILKVTDTHYGHSNKTHKIHSKLFKRMAHIIETESVDVILHGGDWISCDQHQLPRTWKMFREAFPGIPILGVKGNHDLWNWEIFGVHPKKKAYAKLPMLRNIPAIYAQQEEWADQYDIHMLQGKPYETDEVIIYGFDGWYAKPNTSNDKKFMPKDYEGCPIGTWLLHQATSEFDTILEMARFEKDKKKILVSHMPPHDKRLGDNLLESMNAPSRWVEFIIENFDTFCFGHTHFPVDILLEHGNKSCRFINAGTDYLRNHGYDNPRIKLFEV